MNILVFVKQIPEVNRITYDPVTKRIVRTGVPLEINPFDKRAVEEAIRIKEKTPSHVTVISMGPPSAADILNNSLRMGADRAILLTDRQFAGSDTLVTSMVLSDVVRQLNPDLVLCGKYSLDGETSQVPPEIAQMSGLNFKSSVSSISFDIDGKMFEVTQDAETGLVKYAVPFPALFSVSEKINRARYVKPEVPDMRDRIETWDAGKLSIKVSGVEDSPTAVAGTEQINSFRQVKMIGKEDAFSLIVSSSAKKEKNQENHVKMYDPSDDSQVLGVAVGSPEVSLEVSGALYGLSREYKFKITMVGDIDPGVLNGMACHSYVYLKDSTNMETAEYLCSMIRERKPKFVIFPSNIDGREIAGYVAAKLKLGLTADCVDLKVENGELIQYKPAFGGGIVARITSKTSPQMSTVRKGMFRKVITDDVFTLVREEPHGKDSIVRTGFEPVPSGFAPLSSSQVVFGVGKGIARRERIPEITEVASMIGASVGGSRPVVDFGFIPRQNQIGITGESISPELYVALGVSGADNHVVGIRYAKKILAVNSNPEAPIFKYSDYGVISDAYEFLNELRDHITLIREDQRSSR